MSRVGKNPVAVPDGVTVEIIDSILNVKGKLGQQSFTISDDVQVTLDENMVSYHPSRTQSNRDRCGVRRGRV